MGLTTKRKQKFTSLSTPGVKQDCPNYLVELFFLRRNHGIKLPPRFWTQTRYKFQYGREIQGCRKFIKKYGEAAVLQLAIKNPRITSWCDFSTIEWCLQKHQELVTLRKSPKDVSKTQVESVSTDVDLRQPRKTKKSVGLFQRLKELEQRGENG